MSNIIRIKNIKDFINIKDMDAHYSLEKDLDFSKEAFKPIGSVGNPFKGVFDGNNHKISNISIQLTESTCGIFGCNDGLIHDLYIENLAYHGKCKNIVVGSIAGVNKKDIANVHVESGEFNFEINSGECIFGGLVGKNYDNIQNCTSSVDFEIKTTNANVYFGELVGVSESGLIETCIYDGKCLITGDRNKIHAAVFCSIMNNTIIRANRAASKLNLINNKCFTNLYIVDKDNLHRGNSWRDNTNSEYFLSKKHQSVRSTVVKHMKNMAEIRWVPNKTLDYTCSCAAKSHKQVFEKDTIQYGIPYTHKMNSLESFKECFDKEGKLKPFVKTNGWDGFDIYMGVDCSGAIYYSWSTVADNVDFMWTSSMLPKSKKGTLPLGNYDYKFDDTKKIVDSNSMKKMGECLALLEPGDAILSYTKGRTHTRLATHSSVVFREESGPINLFDSYVVTTEQGDGLLHNPPIQKSKSWLVDYEYTFYRLLVEGYVPITNSYIKEGNIAKAKVAYSSKANGIKAICNGNVESNYRIVYTMATIFDGNNSVVFNKKLFTSIYGWSNDYNDRKARTSLRKVYLKDYAPYFDVRKLKSGAEYKYVLEVFLSNNKSYIAKEFTFVA